MRTLHLPLSLFLSIFLVHCGSDTTTVGGEGVITPSGEGEGEAGGGDGDDGDPAGGGEGEGEADDSGGEGEGEADDGGGAGEGEPGGDDGGGEGEGEGEGEDPGDAGGEGEGEVDDPGGEGEGEGEVDPGPQACGSRGLDPCPDHQFCNWAPDADCGRADRPGVCEDIPLRCEKDCPRVCGCDGSTYCNDCLAAAAGMSVDHAGACEGEPEPQVCGTRGAGPCPDGSYCDHPIEANCGRADAPGVCRVIPVACQRDCPQVCGCDGVTYCNACIAAQRGQIGLDSVGPCRDEDIPERCGGIQGLVCENEGDYCHMEPGECRIADGQGACRVRPRACQRDCPGVCGCDSQFYCNECAANTAGVNVLHRGPCRRPNEDPRDDGDEEER